MKKALIIIPALSTCLISAHARFFDFDDVFEHMEQNMRYMRQEMHELQEALEYNATVQPKREHQGSSARITTQEAGIIATINHIQSENIDATIDEDNNLLTVAAGNANITIKIRDAFISLTVQQQTEKELSKNGQRVAEASYSSSSVAQIIARPVQLSQAHVDYDSTSEQLTITLPYIAGKKAKKIPVNIKKIK